MIKTAPEVYHDCVKVGPENNPILYAVVKKALCGCIKSALIIYKKLAGDLINHRLENNAYGPCVASKMVNDKQLTVI